MLHKLHSVHPCIQVLSAVSLKQQTKQASASLSLLTSSWWEPVEKCNLCVLFLSEAHFQHLHQGRNVARKVNQQILFSCSALASSQLCSILIAANTDPSTNHPWPGVIPVASRSAANCPVRAGGDLSNKSEEPHHQQTETWGHGSGGTPPFNCAWK